MEQAAIVLAGNSGELCCLGVDSLVIGSGAVLKEGDDGENTNHDCVVNRNTIPW